MKAQRASLRSRPGFHFFIALILSAVLPAVAQAAAPPVTITSPTNGTILTAPASFTIRASVSGGGNSVSQIEFFEGSRSLGVDTGNPYRIDVTDLAAGSYTLTAVLTDNSGNQSSNSVDIIVNELPAVVITEPADDSGLIAPATFTLRAAASDSDGSVAQLSFQRDSTTLGVVTTNPAALPVRNLGVGSYRFTVTATDNRGGSKSTNINLVVKTRPTVTIGAPAAGARLTAATNIIIGTAADSDGLAAVHYSVNLGSFQTASGTAQWNATLVLPPGTNLVRVRAVDSYGNFSATNSRSFFQVVTSALTLGMTGTGTISGLINGQILEVNRGYQVTAIPGAGFAFSNWTGTISSSRATFGFLMLSNLALTANFVPNPFVRVGGTYQGLFFETNEAHHPTSGDFTLKVTTAGKYSAALRLAGRRLRATGQLDLEGNATNPIPRTGLSPLTVTWAVDLHGLDQVHGSVSDGLWQAELTGDRTTYHAVTNPAPLTARYTLGVQPASAPEAPLGDGWGTIRVAPNGVGVLSGSLPDGTRFARKAPVTRNGDWPLYLPLYQLQGSIVGWIRFDTNAPVDDLRGNVDWFRPTQAGLSMDPAGFTNQTLFTGSRYRAPLTSTNHILELTDALVILAGGNLSQSLTNPVVVGTSRVTNAGPNTLAMTLVPGTGLLKGTFLHPVLNRTIAFNGAVRQKSTNGSGYFLGTNASGRVMIAVP